ncbi:VOC family protein [Corynebacterium sp.]|uniref:VOC family protein n=1 Tax=Corynebacterium sp. TaxID=1720 RepID=UPI0026E0F26D|nr:VOC family protein [Corynebacterium sp.]MDO5512813.1 VOC family protein [Corynebacterium sp.]
MSLRLSHTTFDSRDPFPIAEFWRELLGWEIAEPEIYHPGSEECYLISPDGFLLLFYYSPDVKAVKNRAHLDLRPDGGASRDAEVERALQLGATMVEDLRESHTWAVMADPEGNEFCILNG